MILFFLYNKNSLYLTFTGKRGAMMKKYPKVGWGVLLLAALVLAGCGNKNAQNQNGPEGAGNAGDTPSQSVAEKLKESLYGLVTSGAGVKCTIQDPQAGELTMYAKGDKAKVEGFAFMPMTPSSAPTENSQPPQEEKGTMINDGTWVYMWSGKEGMKFNIEEMKQMSAQNQAQNKNQSQENASDWRDWVKKMDAEGTEYDCSPTVLSDGDFTPPVEIQFQDMGEMMKGFMKMGEEMKNRMPDQPLPQPQQ
jgi:hypothetical protein